MDMDLEQKAIMRLREAADTSERFYKAPLIVTTSGGKDSSVCVALAEKAGIDFEVMHNHTTVDAPETVYFIRHEFKRLEEKGVKCTVNYPHYKGERVTMWSLIPQKLMPPTRLVRYCCSILKERGGQGRYITTGVRWAKSAARKKNRGIFENGHSNPEKRVILNNDNDDRRRLFETCMRQHKAVCNPIIDWSDADVWDYIESEKSRSIRFTSAAFPVSGASGVLWRVRKADKRSLAAIRNTKTHISALSTRCSRSGNAEEKCKAHGERERQAATFSIGGWRTGCSPDKWSSTTSY